MDLATINQLTAPHMAELDKEMARILGVNSDFLNQLDGRVLKATGKRLRPKLLLLTAKALGVDSKAPITYGAVFELIHTATLVHDDIIDEAATRRGQKTLNAEIGNILTVLFGDLLYIRAHRAAAELGSLPALVTIDAVSEKMIEGELLQNKANFDLDIDEATYFDILTRKTAYLFAGTTKAAGLIAGCDEATCEDLFQFGFAFGTSFQLIDDILDYTSSAEMLGKPALSDLRGGKVTLPVIRTLVARPELKDAIRAWWASREVQVPAEIDDAVRASGALEATKQLAQENADKALAHIEDLKLNKYGDMLRALPHYQLTRIN